MKALVYAYIESEECGTDLIAEYDLDETTAERIRSIKDGKELYKEAQRFIGDTEYCLDNCYLDENLIITVY